MSRNFWAENKENKIKRGTRRRKCKEGGEKITNEEVYEDVFLIYSVLRYIGEQKAPETSLH